ncbi:Glycosyl transferase, group 2 family protein [Croceitalea dokdonensis DOKDO 023]|uniref:Glycosyl transferase, group 2 family protein n=1 Tax=Croceitalea dokdonensis DOKDO 023 TaxID=1300341 RepID=A0A0P7AMY6_9FLAO|nr:glycosyltransferase family 2 protein [Croceitalea dokdonensis]KPM33277.1 Glycosyl transferase, group 2 family protein [Croceitalea dokdonensis DOKDO 023]
MGKVSIVVPFKNTSKFLVDCLESIQNQTYQEWEVLAVNDGSTDPSAAVVSRFAQKDGRIRCFDNKGKGIIPALQTAYGYASGNYITRMDSDDIMKTRRLELMVNALQQKGVGHIAVGQVAYFSDQGISNGYQRYEAWLNQLTKKGANFIEIYKECVIPSPCWMVHVEDFERCGGFEHNRYPEDYDLTFRFYQEGLQVIPCKEVLHLWRDYPTRTSRTHLHYAQNYFLDIKLYYFLKLHYTPNRALVIWGAGFKGKQIAKSLVEKKIDFTWLCDNPKKIGKKIYGQPLHHFSKLTALNEPQSIITVANTIAQKEIRQYLDALSQHPMEDYYFFC